MTIRTRRTPQERAADLLRVELARLMGKTAKAKAVYESAQRAEVTTRQAIAMLDELPMPGLETVTELPPIISTPVSGAQGLEVPSPAMDAQQSVITVGVIKPLSITELPPSPEWHFGEGRCPSCDGELPWHYTNCKLHPKAATP
mgnify:CR=1 FL=1